MNNETGELIFLRYAHPVIGYCNDLKVDPNEFSKFETMLKFGGQPSRQRLEELFPDAVKHLRSWSPEDVMDYWLVDHPEIVHDNLLCSILVGSVSDILPPENNEVCRIKMNPLKTTIKSYINLQEEDSVSLHYLQVAQKLSPKQVSQYLKVA